MAIRVKDLPDQIGNDETRGIMLYCDLCDSSFTANKGDYFLHHDDDTLTHCMAPMRLVRKKTVIEDVAPGSWRK